MSKRPKVTGAFCILSLTENPSLPAQFLVVSESTVPFTSAMLHRLTTARDMAFVVSPCAPQWGFAPFYG